MSSATFRLHFVPLREKQIMAAIKLTHLQKHYQVQKKEPGFAGSIKSLFSRTYETVRAVNDISFSIDEGEVIGFIGPNGAGKTTTLKTLSGLLYPTKGKVEVLGFTPFERKNEFLRQISLLMGQKNQLWWDLPAMETFILNKEIYGISDEQFTKVIGELSELLEVEEKLHVPVKRLSLGQRMKMEMIAALIHSPRVLFLDEPTIGLDVVMQEKIREFLKEYNEQYHATIILTSHYMGDVEALCKRVIIINFGKILYDGLLSNLVKVFAPYKQITVVLENPVDPKKLERIGNVKRYDFPQAVLHIPAEKTNEVAAKMLNHFPVRDVIIEEPEIEEVIREVFSEKGKKK